MLYYFTTFIFIAFSLIFYIQFRSIIPEYLRRKFKIGKSMMKKIEKIMRNKKLDQLWYTEQHKKYNLGYIYHINKMYTTLVAVATTVHIALGWHKVFALIFCFLFCVSSIFLTFLSVFANIEYLKSEFGSALIFVGINKRKGIDSILFIPCEVGMIFVAAYTQIKMMIDCFW